MFPPSRINKSGLVGHVMRELLPTPSENDGRNSMLPPSQLERDGLVGHVMRELLPTPRANKVNGCNLNSPALASRNKGNLEEAIARQVVAYGTLGSSRLNPLYVEEMMGFPENWILAPFMKASDE